MAGRRNKALIHIGDATLKFFHDSRDLLSFIGELSYCLWEAAKNPRKIRWKETFYYMDMCGSDAPPSFGDMPADGTHSRLPDRSPDGQIRGATIYG
jgi:hypothetical protein